MLLDVGPEGPASPGWIATMLLCVAEAVVAETSKESDAMARVDDRTLRGAYG